MYRSISSDISFNALDTILRRAINAADNKVLNTIRCYIDAFHFLTIIDKFSEQYYCRAIDVLTSIYSTAEGAADISTRKAINIATEIADTLYSETGDYLHHPSSITERAYREAYALAKEWSNMKPRRKADLKRFNKNVEVAISQEVESYAQSYTAYRKATLCHDEICHAEPINMEKFHTVDSKVSAMYVIGEIQSRCMDMVREITEYVISNPWSAEGIESKLSYSAISSVMKGHFSVSDVVAIEEAYAFYVLYVQKASEPIRLDIYLNKEHL